MTDTDYKIYSVTNQFGDVFKLTSRFPALIEEWMKANNCTGELVDSTPDRNKAREEAIEI